MLPDALMVMKTSLLLFNQLEISSPVLSSMVTITVAVIFTALASCLVLYIFATTNTHANVKCGFVSRHNNAD